MHRAATALLCGAALIPVGARAQDSPIQGLYRAAIEIGGEAWEKAGRIWYRTLLTLPSTGGFAEMVERSLQEAAALFGSRSLEQKAVHSAWKAVGLPA